MLQSKILSVSIARPFRTVYEFVAEPRNFSKWVTPPETRIVQFNATDWVVNFPDVGERMIRFTPRNSFGVADYQSWLPGEQPGPATPVRLYPNGEGTDVTITRFRAPTLTDEQFESQCSWLQSDLARLKTLLEGG
jgi:uncharacterized protein YndB with AHSA1/START domain